MRRRSHIGTNGCKALTQRHAPTCSSSSSSSSRSSSCCCQKRAQGSQVQPGSDRADWRQCRVTVAVQVAKGPRNRAPPSETRPKRLTTSGSQSHIEAQRRTATRQPDVHPWISLELTERRSLHCPQFGACTFPTPPGWTIEIVVFGLMFFVMKCFAANVV